MKLIKDMNDRVCSTTGLLRGFCADSTQGKTKNYLLLIGLALFVQYVLPFLVLLVFIPLVIGDIVSLTVVMILSATNPWFMLGLIPIVAANVGFVAVFVIVSFVVTIIYWIYYFKELGIIALLPVLAWLASFLFSFIPIVGNIVSMLISITPWMAIAAAGHWWIYRNDGKRNGISA